MIRPAPARLVALTLSAMLVAAACGASTGSVAPSSAPSVAPSASAAPSESAAPSASSAGSVDATYDKIVAEVLELRGLEPAEVARETIDEATLAEMSRTDFDKDNPADYVAANEQLYKALGLLDGDQSLRDLYLDLIASQVAGFYRPDAKSLYVVSRSGEVNGADKVTFAHEYDHALQDANFDVFADPEALRDRSDEALARAALYEGDATLLMSQWLVPNLTPEEIQEVLAAGSDPESTAVLERTPQVLSESLLFPYNAGVAWLQGIQLEGGWPAVDAIYDRLPASTEQVMHPEKYQADERPIEVAMPSDLATGMGDGWSVALEDTFGEFQTGLWLRDSGVEPATAMGAAAGWGGDRLAVLEGPDGAWAVALQTEWDSAEEAAAFESAAGTAVKEAGGPAQVLPGAGDTTRWVVVGSDDDVLSSLAGSLGLAG